MNYLKLLLLFVSFSLPSFIYAENEKIEIPTEDKWGEKADGWFNYDTAQPTEGLNNYEHNRENLYIYPKH